MPCKWCVCGAQRKRCECGEHGGREERRAGMACGKAKCHNVLHSLPCFTPRPHLHAAIVQAVLVTTMQSPGTGSLAHAACIPTLPSLLLFHRRTATALSSSASPTSAGSMGIFFPAPRLSEVPPSAAAEVDAGGLKVDRPDESQGARSRRAAPSSAWAAAPPPPPPTAAHASWSYRRAAGGHQRGEASKGGEAIWGARGALSLPAGRARMSCPWRKLK